MQIVLTEKKTVVLPDEVWESMGLEPGDVITLERKTIGGRVSWLMSPRDHDLSWFGSLKKYAKGKSHDMKDIRESIGKGIGEDIG